MAPIGDISLLGFAFVAGAFTFFAPCAYPLLPGYVSYYLGRTAERDGAVRTDGDGMTTSGVVGGRVVRAVDRVLPAGVAAEVTHAIGVGLLVSLGFILVYGVLAGAVVAVGAQALASISVLELVVGAILIVLGAAMALGWKPKTPRIQLPERRRSPAGFVGFGVLYAGAAAGCTAPIFIAVSLKALSASPMMGLGAFGAYAAGMSVLMIGVTVASALGRDAIFSRITKRMDRITQAAGVLLVVAGIVQIYFFVVRFQGLSLLGF